MQVNGQSVQLSDIVARLSIEDRLSLTSSVQTALERDLELILSRTKKVACCHVCKKYLHKDAYTGAVALVSPERGCGHVFHASCVADAVAREPKCPVCHTSPVFMVHLVFNV